MRSPIWYRWLQSLANAWWRPSIPARRRSWCYPRVEYLENRVVPSTLTVTSNADSGPGTLRAAVNTANQNQQNSYTIQFALPAGQTTIGLSTNDSQFPFASGPTALTILNTITITGNQ